jgi:hypothetical protein
MSNIVMRVMIMLLGVLLCTLPAQAKRSLSDLQGYSYSDSNETGGPTYAYEDISATGTPTGLWDGERVAIPIGFTFNFYGTDYNYVSVGDNGYLVFDGVTSTTPVTAWSANWNVLPIPQPAPTAYDWVAAGPFLAPMFTDLDAWPGTDDIYWEVRGTAPNRRLIVQYHVAPYWSWSYDYVDFEAILYEGSNQIVYQYKDVEVVLDPALGTVEQYNSYGNSATVGIQASDTLGYNYSNGEASLSNGLAIRFSPPTGPYIGVASTPAAAAAGGIATHTVQVSNQTGADTTFTVSVNAGGQWPVTAPAATGVVTAGATASFNVDVQAPALANMPPFSDLASLTISGNGQSTFANLETRSSPFTQISPGVNAQGQPTEDWFVTSADHSVIASSNIDYTTMASEIVVSDINGTVLRSVQAHDTDSRLALTPNGATLLFVSSSDHVSGQNADGGDELFALDIATGTITQLTSVSSPAAGTNNYYDIVTSLDSSKVAFSCSLDLIPGSNSTLENQVFVLDLTTGALTQATHNVSGGALVTVASFDASNQVVFSSPVQLDVDPAAVLSQGNCLFTWGAAGLKRIATIDLRGGYSTLSQDASKIAFISRDNPTGNNVDGSLELFTFDLTTGTYVQVSNNWFPANFWVRPKLFSANGSQVAMVSHANLTGQNPYQDVALYVVNVDGTGLMQVASSPEWVEPAYSGYFKNGQMSIDSDREVKISGQKYKGGLYLLNVDGTGVKLLETDAGTRSQDGFITADGIHLLMETESDLVGKNPGGLFQLYVMNTSSLSLLDSDGDGIPDASEPATAFDPSRVNGLPMSVGGATVDIAMTNGEALSGVSTASALNPPAGIAFPFGTISYRVAAPVGGSVTTRFTFSAPIPTNMAMFKVDANGNYSTIPVGNWVQTGANTLELTLTDGGPFDLDGTANGFIVDPFGIGVDSVPPVVTAPADVTAYTAGTQAAVATGTATATDNLDGTLPVSSDAPAQFPVGTTVVTWSATDSAGNTGTAQQNVTVIQDATAPVITLPADVVVTSDWYMTLVDLGQATAMDNIDGPVAVSNDTPSPYFAVGTHIITWSATDSVGNVATATQTVTVIDGFPPTLTVPADVVMDATGPLTTVSLGTASAMDDVDGALVPTNDAPTGGFPLGTTIVTWSAVDSAGNRTTAEQLVVIRDAGTIVPTPIQMGAVPPEQRPDPMDGGGYSMIDSDTSGGSVYNYEPISATGALLSLQDNDDAVVPLGFTFNFYGVDYSKLTIGSNGYLAFGASIRNNNPDALPVPQAGTTAGWNTAPFLAPLFSDLNPVKSWVPNAVYWEVRGTAPNRRFIVQYKLPPAEGLNNDPFDFEVILFEGSNEILYQYHDVENGKPGSSDFDHSHASYGARATVGIQGGDTIGLNYANGIPALHKGLAIQFSPKTGNYVVVKDRNSTGKPGSVVSHTLTVYNHTGADADFAIAANGYRWPVSVPATTGLIPAGGSSSFTMDVSVPVSSALPPYSDSVTLQLTANGQSHAAQITTKTMLATQLTPPAGIETTNKLRYTSDGSRAVFISTGDPLATNADGNAEAFMINGDGSGLTQLTNYSLGSVYGIDVTAVGGRAAIIADGDIIAGQNPDLGSEIFLIDTAFGQVSQLTSTTGESPVYGRAFTNVAISADGSKVACVSYLDLVPGHNSDGSLEVFMIDVATGVIRQLTDSNNPGPWRWFDWSVTDLSLSSDGSHVAFRSNVTFTGSIVNRHVFHTYQWSAASGLTRLDGTDEMVMSGDGSTLAWVGTSDPAGMNADGSRELFAVDMVSGSTTQVTNQATVVYDDMGSIAMSSVGGKLVFVSSDDLVAGQNPNGAPALFLINTDGTGLMQLSPEGLAKQIVAPSISVDGSRVAFAVTDSVRNGYDLYIVNSDGSGLHRVVTSVTDPSVVLSADGGRLGMVSSTDMTGDNPLHKLQAFNMNLTTALNLLDSDGDGIPDVLEGPGGAFNASTASGLPMSYPPGTSASIAAPVGSALSSVSVHPLTNPAPVGIQTWSDEISFNVTSPVGGSVTVVLSFSTPLPSTGLSLLKVRQDGSYVFMTPGVDWQVAGTNSLSITLTDGGPLDLDGIANGVIVDPMFLGLDNAAPVVTAPADITVEAIGSANMSVALGAASATDNVDGAVAVSNDAPAAFPVGTTVVTWSATDAAGNTGTATQQVTVTDTTAPVVTAPVDVAVEATGPTTSVALGTATATDLVDGAVAVSNDAPAAFPVGTMVVTWSATDAAGNTGTATQQVTVEPEDEHYLKSERHGAHKKEKHGKMGGDFQRGRHADHEKKDDRRERGH